MTCEVCKETYSAMGFHNHVGSKACGENVSTRPLRLKVAQRRRNLMETKRPVRAGFIQACERRELTELIGAKRCATKYVAASNGQPAKINMQWWVWTWVKELYVELSAYRGYSGNGRSSNPTYDALCEIRNLKPRDQESAVGLMILKYVEL